MTLANPQFPQIRKKELNSYFMAFCSFIMNFI